MLRKGTIDALIAGTRFRKTGELGRGALYAPEGYIGGAHSVWTWPKCKTCCRDVDACSVKDISRNRFEFWATCHGAEDYASFDIPEDVAEKPDVPGPDGYTPKWQFIRQSTKGMDFFDPTHGEKAGDK